MHYLKQQCPPKLDAIAHPPTWNHIHHDREREHSAGELVFGDEARGRCPHSSHRSQHNSGIAGHGRGRTSGAMVAADNRSIVSHASYLPPSNVRWRMWQVKRQTVHVHRHRPPAWPPLVRQLERGRRPRAPSPKTSSPAECSRLRSWWMWCCYLLSTVLDFLEEERMMQQSSISIFLSF